MKSLFQILIIILLTAHGAAARTWTSADGKKTFDGELISYDPVTDLVDVKLTNDKTMAISTKVLSEADIVFLNQKGKVEAPYSRYVRPGSDGKLHYQPNESGDIIPDFSYCGYMGGGVRLPDAPVKITIEPSDGDDGIRIQTALDEIGKLSPDAKGTRGAVLLKRGNYQIAGSLQIKQSGVILRGEGDDEKGTIITASGKAPRDSIRIAGLGSRAGRSTFLSRRKILGFQSERSHFCSTSR
jgi:hypothetical protein